MSTVNLCEAVSCGWETAKSCVPNILVAGAAAVGILGVVALSGLEDPAQFKARGKVCHKMSACEEKINAYGASLLKLGKKRPDILQAIEQANVQTTKEAWVVTRPMLTEKESHKVKRYFDKIESLERKQAKLYQKYKTLGGQ